MNKKNFFSGVVINVFLVLLLPNILSAMEANLAMKMMGMSEEELTNFIKSTPASEINKKYGKTEQTMLHIATTMDNKKAVKLLIVSQCDVNPINREGITPLMFARLSHNWEMHELLKEAGACEGEESTAFLKYMEEVRNSSTESFKKEEAEKNQ